MSAAYERLLDALHAHGSTVRANGSGAIANCPAADHDDRNPSLSVNTADQFAGVVVKCHRQCHLDDVLAPLRLTRADLFDEPRDRSAGYTVVAEYPYVDEHGAVLFVQERRYPKDFRCKRPDGAGGWTYKLGDTRRVLYRLPEVLAGVQAGRPVYVVEGERDADRLTAAGQVATTSPLGAGKWRREYGDALAGARVVVVADRDVPGWRHARAVAADLAGKAASVEVVQAAEGNDLSDHLDADRALEELVPLTLDELDRLAAETAQDAPGGPLRDEHPDPGTAEADDRKLEQALAYAREVDAEARRLRVREDARELVRAQRAAEVPSAPFDAGTLGEVLARPPEPPYRVEGLLPSGGTMLVSAQRKTGKTTLMLNLARSLLTGEPFLASFETRPVAGTVALLNYEVSAAQLARWAADVGIDPDRLYLVNLRGRRNPLGDLEDRARLVELLVLHSVSTLIVDPFGRAYVGKSQNDPGEVSAWLGELDRLTADVGATETVLSAHAGWNGERTRGASALEDWPDSIVTLVRDSDDESMRFLRAIGRDVEVDEDQLAYDPRTRLLRLSGTGPRKAVAADRRLDEVGVAVAAVLAEREGLSLNGLSTELRKGGTPFRNDDVPRAVARAVERGELEIRAGPRRAKLVYRRRLPPPLPTSPRENSSTSPTSTYRGEVGVEAVRAGDFSPGEDERDSASSPGAVCLSCGRLACPRCPDDSTVPVTTAGEPRPAALWAVQS